MGHREAQPAEFGVGAFRQPGPQPVAVVVAPAGHETPGPGLERVEQSALHPVAGMDHHVRGVHRVPYLRREVAGPLRDVCVGDQQKAHVTRLRRARHPKLPHGPPSAGP